jgi:ATP-binding cassette subfamily B protein
MPRCRRRPRHGIEIIASHPNDIVPEPIARRHSLSDPATPNVRADIGALRLLIPYLRPYKLRVAGAWIAMAVAAALLLGLGQGLRQLIDRGFSAGNAGQLNVAAAVMFVVVALLGLSTAVRFFLVSWLGERTAADIRRDLFNHVISLSPAFFETARTGDILARMNGDIAVLQSLVGSAVSQYLRSAVLMAGAMIMLLITSAKLAGIVLLVVPVVVAPLILFGRRERKQSRAAQERVADLGAAAEEALSGLRTLQGVEASVNMALARVRTRAIQILMVIILGFGAITFSLWVGGRDVIAGRITGGDLSAFVFYAILLATSGAAMSELWGEVQRAAGAAQRVAELLAEIPLIRAPAHPLALPPARGAVAFEAVTFSYPARPDTPSLIDFSLSVQPGETVAIVGPSGAGKTSLFQLLLRFYDPQRGVVRMDGVDVSQLDPQDLRARIGLVPQDPVIFSVSALENIRYGRPDATDAEVLAAVVAANATFLHDLPQGLGTYLGEKGVRLSGGQRQRIAIARAVLRDPPVLLLDEATSALDAEAERAVQDALATLAVGRTTLVVAHRLATIRNADRIVVMEAGRIVETGRHGELVERGGLYARLAALQFTEATPAFTSL